MKIFFIFFCSLFLLFINFNVFAKNKKIIIASTTSTYDSGLLTYLNKNFEKKYEINVQVISQGTGQAIRSAKDGNVEILLVHHEVSELNFMKEGYGLKRYKLMYNDFIIVGPKKDNDRCINIKSKLKKIINNKLSFISRGDDSGTHKKELELWKFADLNPENFSKNYLSIGQGMGNTLLITNEKSAYTLVDRGTWISFNRKENLKIICEDKPPLFNQYGLILVDPKINKNLDVESAKLYVNWLLSNNGKNLINNYKINDQQLFFYNYK